MVRPIRFRVLLCAAIAVICVLGGQASQAETLRLVTGNYSGDGNAPGFPAEVITQVFAAMGQGVSIEAFPPARGWMMIVRGERDGTLAVLRSPERVRYCSFPDEPVLRDKYVLFVRTADIGRLKFMSFDDLVGHDVAFGPGHPELSPELWKFLSEHHNGIETSDTTEGFRMLAAGRVDYVASNLGLGIQLVATMGLSVKIVPLLSRSVFEAGFYTCFTKSRVSPALVATFSRALKQFKQTEAYQAIYRKYYPPLSSTPAGGH
jgi:polar amino acid transport system substrate-binding protein